MIVVLFSTVDRPDMDEDEYGRTEARMEEIVASIPGFISYNDYTSADGDELGIARFDSMESLEAWRTHLEHLAAQEKGKTDWIQEYWVQAATVEHEYHWSLEGGYGSDLRERFVAGSEIAPSSERMGPA